LPHAARGEAVAELVDWRRSAPSFPKLEKSFASGVRNLDERPLDKDRENLRSSAASEISSMPMRSSPFQGFDTLI